MFGSKNTHHIYWMYGETFSYEYCIETEKN